MKIVILEDEQASARLLSRKIEARGHEVLQIIDSVKRGCDWFNSHKAPDLIFVDIQLADGLSFEIFENTALHCPLIFTTAYDHFALKAFKLNSIDYLLKPIDSSELDAALEKLNKRNAAVTLDLSWAQDFYGYKQNFSVYAGEHLKIIPTESIAYFYSAFKSTFLVTYEGKTYTINDSLDALETLCNPHLFYRVNRQHFVALKAIQSIKVFGISRLELTTSPLSSAPIIVSRARVSDFKRWINK